MCREGKISQAARRSPPPAIPADGRPAAEWRAGGAKLAVTIAPGYRDLLVRKFLTGGGRAGGVAGLSRARRGGLAARKKNAPHERGN
jgi:hypothetical protein